MAAPTWVKSDAGTVITATTGTTTSFTSVTAGNLIILQVLQDGTSTDMTLTDTNSSVEDLSGTDNTMTEILDSGTGDNPFQVGNPSAAKQFLWVGRALTTTITIDVASSGGDDLYCQVHEFSGVHTGTALSDIIENGTAGSTLKSFGTSTSVNDADVQTLGADRLACNFIGINDDNIPVSFTGETGGDWALVANFGVATGTDGEVGLQTATIASAGTIGGGTYTQASDAWGVIGFALIPGSGGSTYTKAGYGKESG